MNKNPPTSKILVFGSEIEPKDSFHPRYQALTLMSLRCSIQGLIMADAAKIIHLSIAQSLEFHPTKDRKSSLGPQNELNGLSLTFFG